MPASGKIEALHLRRASLLLTVAGVLLAATRSGAAADAIPGCTPAVGRVVSLQGSVELLRAGQGAWARVNRLDVALCQGDQLRVGLLSRAALFISPETLVRVDQNTTLGILSQTGQETLVEFRQDDVTRLRNERARSCGTGYFITRFPRKFRVRTPFYNAVVEGTEFQVALQCDRGELSVFEGKVAAEDMQTAASRIVLESGQSTSVGLGERPSAVKVLVKPVDAVQWALYYPPVSDVAAIGESVVQEECGVLSGEQRSACVIRRAEYLLRVGRASDAGAELDRLLESDPANGEALALGAIIAIAKNDKARALELSTKATQVAPTSFRTWAALSYARQAGFRLDDALSAANRAAELAPQSALMRARVAELHLSLGRIRDAEREARQAVTLNPKESRAHLILGFAHLAQINTKSARQDFLSAIDLDSTEPLARLGLGLAVIREGNLKDGREQLEIAVALDPTNSLLRSYVGKAYYEENTKDRDKLAATQFGLAKQLDPNDPTPWYYDAILKQTQNRPVEALEDLQKSVQLNDNRAVYRSRLSLDQDRAVREVSIARTYSELGFGQLAVSEAARSLSLDPASASAHRFLSETYSALNRNEISRVSELLQAQLLQPLNINPVPPSTPFTDLHVLSSTGAMASFLNDYSRLFERDGVRLSASGLAGNLGTRADEVSASALMGKLAVSAGQYYYTSDGFRANNDATNEIYNTFVQFDPDDAISLQAEYRKRLTNHGDIRLNFDPNDFNPQDRYRIDQETMRVGLRLTPSPGVRILGSAIESRRQERQMLFPANSPDADLQDQLDGRSYELQVQYLQPRFNLIAGAGYAPVTETISATFDFTKLLGIACLPPLVPCSAYGKTPIDQDNQYLYANIGVAPGWILTLGVSHDMYDDGATELRPWNPKAGLQWLVTDSLRFRVAAFSTLKRSLVVDQTIEPTQVAGFSQFFDDANGTESNVFAAGVDMHFTPSLRASVEGMHRDLKLGPGLVGATLSTTPPQRQWEDTLRATVYWTARKDTVLSAGYALDDFRWNPTLLPVPLPDPTALRTQSMPFSIRLFRTASLYAQATATYVRQSVERLPGAPGAVGQEEFVTVDIGGGYLLPGRKGAIGLEVRNLFDQNFFFQDDNFRTSEFRTPRYIPARSAFLKLWLVF